MTRALIATGISPKQATERLSIPLGWISDEILETNLQVPGALVGDPRC